MKTSSNTTAPCRMPGITRRRLLTTLGGALGFSALPDSLIARDPRGYWPADDTEQGQLVMLCPPKLQAWLRACDPLTARHFFSQIADQAVPLEHITAAHQELSLQQLKPVRQKALAFVRHLPEHSLARQAAAARCTELAHHYELIHYQLHELRRDTAGRPGITSLAIPVSRGLEYVIIVATDALSHMGVPFHLRALDEDDPSKRIAWDHRALAQGLALIRWTSGFNGTVEAQVEFLPSAVFEQGKTVNWHAMIGRRAAQI